MTASGQARVAREDGLESRFFPIDYARYLKRILDPLPPLLFVAVETEIWPETLRLLALRKVPAAVANARLSEASLPRYRRFRALLEPLVAGLATVCARDDEAAEKWRSLGASESALEVTGNIKFDLANPAGELMVVPLFERSSRTAGRTVAHDGPLLLAASTHEGEEALALDAFALVRARRDDARIIVAPRHPERTDAAIAAARERGLRTAKWGHLRAAKLPALWPSDLDVVVIDRLGLLRSAYEAADAAFVGGSAVEGPGGHNLLEPVTAGCAVATGPHLGNVADQSALLLEAKALRIVKDVAELSKFWLEVLDKPQIFSSATRTAVGRIRTRKGALDRTVAMLLSLVEKSARRA